MFFAGSIAATVTFSANAAVDVWTIDSLSRASKIQEKPDGAVNSISMVTAKHEYEGGQIILRSSANFTVNSVSFTDLSSAQGDLITNDNFKFNFVDYEQLEVPTRTLGGAQPFIYPASNIPDPFSNKLTMDVNANTTQPIFTSIYIPRATVAALYTGTITVNTSDGVYTTPLTVDVQNVTIPDAKDSAFDQYIWTEFDSFSLEHNADVGLANYGLTKYSPDWWNFVSNSAGVMEEHRQTRVLVWTVNLLNDANTTIDADGTINFDWTLFDKFIETFRAKGIEMFAGGHLAYHWNGNPGSYPNGNEIVRLARNTDGSTFITGGSLPTSLADEINHPEIRHWMEEFIPALEAHLIAKGWDASWYQHVYDEPPIDNWVYLQDKLKSLAPNMDTMDAIYSTGLQGQAANVTTWVPTLPLYESRKNFYKAQQALNKKLYIYTTQAPAAPGLNRLIANAVITNDLMSWYLFKERADGFLHWALNLWSYGYANGDTTVTYPDRVNNTLLSSIRYEAQRDGLENWELLNIVRATNPALADDFVDHVLDTYLAYTRDVEYYKTVRSLLVKAAAGQTVTLPTKPEFITNVIATPGSSIINDDDSSITYTGSWDSSTSRSQFDDYNADAHYTTVNGDDFSITFTGTEVAFYAETKSDYGTIDIFIDGVLETTVDAGGADGRDGQVKLFSKSGLTPGSHTMKGVKVSGDYMLVDAFVIKGDGTYNDNSSAISYSEGQWNSNGSRNLGDIEDDVHYATVDGAYAEFTFVGTSVKYITEKNSDMGEVEIFIDNISQGIVDANNASRLTQQELFVTSNLSAGTHTIKVVKISGQYALLDGFVVRSPYIVNDDNLFIIYSDFQWTSQGNRGFNDYLDDIHYTETNGASIEFTFDGTGIEYISEKNSDMGNMEVFIDNVSQGLVNSNSSSRLVQQVIYSKTGLSDGTHTIKLVKRSGVYALIDAFKVL